MHQSTWIETSLMESLILHGSLYIVKTRVSTILQTKHNISDQPGSFSNERRQLYMVPEASHLDVKTQSMSMLHKHMASMSTRLWHPYHSIGWRKYIRFWNQDQSVGWRKFIRLWDLDHSTGWHKATSEMSAKNYQHVVAWLCQQRGSENKNSTCPTKWDNSEATCSPLLQIAFPGRDVPANQTLR